MAPPWSERNKTAMLVRHPFPCKQMFSGAGFNRCAIELGKVYNVYARVLVDAMALVIKPDG